MLKTWMVIRYLKDGRRYLSLSFVLSVLGIALGVAALVISMAVVSGYETTLRRTVINMQGHLMVMQHGGVEGDLMAAEEKIKATLPEAEKLSRFVLVDALLAHKKKLSGVLLEGVETSTIDQVLSLQSTLVAGTVSFEPDEDRPAALVGKGIAQKFSLSPGDEFRMVIPVSRSKSAEGFRPKMQRFVVRGVLDLGRADFDSRYVLTDLTSAQKFGEVEGRLSGWRIKLSHHDLAVGAARRVEDELKFPFWARSWRDVNRNLFQAVQYERAVIFVIVLLMVVAAAFNVACTLFLSVVRRYSQISILKAMGVSSRFIRQLFTQQGLVIGFLGSVLGLIMGWGGCHLFLWAEKHWSLFPGEVYKLDHVDLEIRFLDVTLIVICTMVICYVSTLAPARRGAKLLPVEGLKYE